MEWQPIETAPKDGTLILLSSPNGRIADGMFIPKYGVWSWPYVVVNPTHWAQLPNRPGEEMSLNKMEIEDLKGITMSIAMELTPKKVDIDKESLFIELEWEGDKMDIFWLERGFIHLTKDAAIAHAKAIIKASGGTVDD